jgi:hypothetical protein
MRVRRPLALACALAVAPRPRVRPRASAGPSAVQEPRRGVGGTHRPSERLEPTVPRLDLERLEPSAAPPAPPARKL